MKQNIHTAALTCLLMMGSSAQAGNLWQPTRDCNAQSISNDNFDPLIVDNSCDYKVSVVQCDNTQRGNERCGGRASHYYTDLADVMPHGSLQTADQTWQLLQFAAAKDQTNLYRGE